MKKPLTINELKSIIKEQLKQQKKIMNQYPELNEVMRKQYNLSKKMLRSIEALECKIDKLSIENNRLMLYANHLSAGLSVYRPFWHNN